MKKIILIFAVGVGAIVPLLAFASAEISVSIPGTATSTDAAAVPGTIINNFYQFALLIGGLLALGVIVFGGVKYMISAGNPSGQSEAKEWIWAALIGILLLAGAYLVLYTINPDLVSLALPELSSTGISFPTGGPTGGGPTGGPGTGTGSTSTTPTTACTAPASGPCTVANLQNTCFASNAQVWAGICNKESRGNPSLLSGSDYCLPPPGTSCPTGKCSISGGLFQINITNSWKQQVDGESCSDAFVNGNSGAGQAIHCSGKGPCTGSSGQQCQLIASKMPLYYDCLHAIQQASDNISVACQLSNNGTNYGPWKADRACYQ